MRRCARSVTVLGFVCLSVASGCEREGPPVAPPPPPPSGPALLIGSPVPDFKLAGINGETLSKDGLKGKVVLVDFWATWCGPCRFLPPILQSLHEEYGNRGLVVIGANADEKDQNGEPTRTKDAALTYSKAHGLTYAFAYGADDFMDACSAVALPTVLLIDRSGVVRNVQVGFDEGLRGTFAARVETLLAEPK